MFQYDTVLFYVGWVWVGVCLVCVLYLSIKKDGSSSLFSFVKIRKGRTQVSDLTPVTGLVKSNRDLLSLGKHFILFPVF